MYGSTPQNTVRYCADLSDVRELAARLSESISLQSVKKSTS